tara:strand:- start:92 stop:304 length:213 start_codon:yes stop_codon:yes gene_type:complete
MKGWHGGSGSGRRREDPAKSFNTEGRPSQAPMITEEVEMWDHNCIKTGMISVKRGELCSWCGNWEEGSDV